MDLASAKMIGAGLACIALVGAGVGIGNVFSALITSVARNPASQAQVQPFAFLGFALAEAASAAYQKTLAEARAQAQSTIKETSDRLAAVAAERQRALAATLVEQIEAAERRIAATKEQALAEVRGIAVDVGRSVVEKLTGAVPDAAKMAAAVDSRLSGRAR